MFVKQPGKQWLKVLSEGLGKHYKNLSLGKIPPVDPLMGIFDPKLVFFHLRKSQKSKEIQLCFEFGGHSSADYLW